MGGLGWPEILLLTIILTFVGGAVAVVVILASLSRRTKGRDMPGSQLFCKNCGNKLIGVPEICPNCGARPSTGIGFCQNCGVAVTPMTEICVKCGARTAPSSVGGKSKTTAVLLAVFLSYWTWLYTYKKNAWKFWLNLGLVILSAGFWGIVAWIWAIIDNATKPAEWFESY